MLIILKSLWFQFQLSQNIPFKRLWTKNCPTFGLFLPVLWLVLHDGSLIKYLRQQTGGCSLTAAVRNPHNAFHHSHELYSRCSVDLRCQSLLSLRSRRKKEKKLELWGGPISKRAWFSWNLLICREDRKHFYVIWYKFIKTIRWEKIWQINVIWPGIIHK